MAAQTCQYCAIWNYNNYRASLGLKFDNFFGQVWFKEKKYCLCQKWRIFNVAISVLKFVVNCESFGIEESLHGTCFGHAFSKACQYGTAEEKNCKNLKYVSIKFAQIDL